MIPSTGIVRATSSSSRVQAHRRTAQLLHHLQLSTTSRQTLRSMSFPTTIQAIAIDKIGDIDVVEKKAVHYAGVNFIDTYYRMGLYPIKSFPQVLGMEASGVVAALPTDENVLKDEEFKKRGLKIGRKVAVNFLGVHGEYASVPWAKVFPVPESVSLRTAGAALLQGLTAVTFVEEAYNVKQGDYVLIHTIAGGLGLLLCQLVKHRGGIVIGTTSSKEKAEIAAAHGADYVILYPVENTVERVLEITHGEGVHVVYDGVGKDTFMDNFKLTRRKGTMVSVGNASGAVEPVPPLKLVEKNLVLLRPTMANYIYTPEEAQYYSTRLFDLIASGVLKINIFKEYPFTTAGAQEAQRDLTVRSGKTVGKLIIKVAEE
ncbi:putative quinone oxidoreductase [Grifola frondosa]|uniref:Probable quinone oxidoreductase n=1 Tax=Grifola frondosa TaxID=5627 RepID=A0A1C7MTB2_GRIFR|nr:putative quinone oxidoreductase [Grifola frondosa]